LVNLQSLISSPVFQAGVNLQSALSNLQSLEKMTGLMNGVAFG